MAPWPIFISMMYGGRAYWKQSPRFGQLAQSTILSAQQNVCLLFIHCQFFTKLLCSWITVHHFKLEISEKCFPFYTSNRKAFSAEL